MKVRRGARVNIFCQMNNIARKSGRVDLPKFATACRIRGGGSVGRNGLGVRGSFLKWCRGGIRYSNFYQLGVG